ncbi:MAG: Sir2 family NAD-dependent protein deacetylase [Ottowia sp.]|nr:Sir2 family NAD-dependent protein deacetylase [Ottowia sp.]
MDGSNPVVSELARQLAAAQRVVAFTGAGMSTESGIPDFRSPGGIWSRMQPIQFQDFVRSAEAQRESWRRVFDGERDLSGKQPNIGHEVLARWVKAGRISHIITQNVDNLHQASGVADEHIIELHGNAGYVSCLECHQRYEIEDLRPEYELTGEVRDCDSCGGLLKVATVSFGQPMPDAEMARAERAAQDCDLFLSMGSSLQVYPAAGLPQAARAGGARLVIINREATPLDSLADLVIHAEIGATLAAAQQLLDA